MNVSHSDLMGIWERATGTYFCENIPKLFKIPLVSDFTAISGSVDSTKSQCTTYGLKHVIEYHKDDKILI